MAIGNIFQKMFPGDIPRIVGGPYQPPVQPTQPQAQAGLPLIIQQLYGGAQFTPGADTMEGGFRTSPGFRPGSPMNINMPSTFAPGYGSSINNPGIRTADFRDSDGDGIDDRDQIGPGQPRVQSPGFSFGNTFGLGPMAQTTLADLSAFNPVANQYALAGFTVGEILAMPEFADFAQSQAEQTGGTATSAGLAALEARLRDRGGPEDRGSYSDRFGTAEDQGFSFSGGSGQYKNPNDPFGDTFSPAPDLGYALDQFGRERNIGIPTDLGLNLANLVGPFAKNPIGIFGAVNKVTDVFKNFREKQKEAEAKAKAEEAKAIAEENKRLADEIKKQLEDRKKKQAAKELAEKTQRARELQATIDRNREASNKASGFSSDTTAPGTDASTIGGTGGRRAGAGPGRGGNFGGDNTGGRDAGTSGGTGGRRGGAGPF
jgi:hypothetical protein